ncbi:MAG: hypothetical protein GY926_22650 [bacterium]|nr:hypothetical protein [bacterium]
MNRHLRLEAATNYGPRITAFSLRNGGDNIFAELGDLSIDLPDGRTYRLRGGHRLWAAPEVPAITYEPDNDPPVLEETSTGVHLTQPAPQHVAVEKSITVALVEHRAIVSHTMTNRGGKPLRLAPWAITQLAVGGTGIVPLRHQPADPNGHQPNANITLWPYTGSADSGFALQDRLLLVDANRTSPTKVGTSLDRGWLAYVRNGLVFVKRSQLIAGGRYLDLGASAQCYCNQHFIELETLGELVTLEQDESVSHNEIWELHQVPPTVPPSEIPHLLDLDGGTGQ